MDLHGYRAIATFLATLLFKFSKDDCRALLFHKIQSDTLETNYLWVYNQYDKSNEKIQKEIVLSLSEGHLKGINYKPPTVFIINPKTPRQQVSVFIDQNAFQFTEKIMKRYDQRKGKYWDIISCLRMDPDIVSHIYNLIMEPRKIEPLTDEDIEALAIELFNIDIVKPAQYALLVLHFTKRAFTDRPYTRDEAKKHAASAYTMGAYDDIVHALVKSPCLMTTSTNEPRRKFPVTKSK
jgi:hypothetical protein